MRNHTILKILVAAVGVSNGSVWAVATTFVSQSLPTVDLGYAIHQATLNEAGQIFNFSNIRYAAPPIGNLRFAEPVPPQGRNRTVNDGQQYVICPQAFPGWEVYTLQVLQGVNASTIEAEEAASSKNLSLSDIPKPGPGEAEDCLFLDVVVPKSIFLQNKTKRKRNVQDKRRGVSPGAPVLVWIYGGGYVEGSKYFDPAGLISQSQKNGGDGFVFVAMNYRLGMFGWLSGPTFQQGGTANAALYDQRLALEWVQTYIHLFGGDPKRVTVMGESAGGGSIIHQITAYGGLKGEAPFQQAIPQSPAWQPITTNAQKEDTFNKVLQYATLVSGSPITSLSQLRKLPSTTLQTVNAIIVGLSSYGMFTFGPAVDGKFVPALPGLLLLYEQFDHNVKLMIGHNSNESILFTSPLVTNETAFDTYIENVLPAASNNVLSFLENVLYPPVFDGSNGYTNEVTRLSLAIAESTFTCNTRYLDLAFKNQTYSYYFTIPPGLHGEDIAYTFFNGDSSTLDLGPPPNATVAQMFQSYITNFVVGGNPNGNEGNTKLPYFPLYSDGSITLDIDSLGDGKTQKDELANVRCAWWQKALYD